MASSSAGSVEEYLEVNPDTHNGQPLLYMALAAQKNHFAVYTTGAYMDPGGKAWVKAEFEKAGKKLDMGKSCIRFKKLENLPLEVIGTIAAGFQVEEFIEATDKIHRKK